MIVSQRQELILRPDWRSRSKSDFRIKLRRGRELLATNCDCQTFAAFSATTRENGATVFGRHTSAEAMSGFAALVAGLVSAFAHLKLPLDDSEKSSGS